MRQWRQRPRTPRPRPQVAQRGQVLILGKLIALCLVTALISLYATLILFFFWHLGHPESFPLIWLGFWSAALIYGGFGVLLGVLVMPELAGFFLVIMLSLFDAFLQNPVGNPVGNQPISRDFPSFGALQLDVAGGFTSTVPWASFALSLAWFVGFALLGLALFGWRTRARNARIAQGPAGDRPALTEDSSPTASQFQVG